MGKPIVMIALVALLTAGCTSTQQAAAGLVAAKRMAFNDAKARLTLVSTCDITVGAFFRLPPSYQRSIEAICGGEPLANKPILAKE